MLPLLFPFITDTVIAPPPDYEDIFVNEWGVVVFSSDGASVAGAPDEQGGVYFGRQPFGPVCVDAPVIWIHGAFFGDATFTVKAKQGWITSLYPEAETEQGEDMPVVASWEIKAPPPVPLTRRLTPPDPGDLPFAWAMDIWREVPCRDLCSSETGEYLGNFLYYETGIPYWTPPDGIYDAGMLAGHYATEGLIIVTGSDPVLERIQLVPLPDGTGGGYSSDPLSDEDILGVICGWAGGNLKSEEIEALWATWKPFFTTQPTCDQPVDETMVDRRGSGERWILFPLPWDEVEKISTIDLDIHGGHSGTIYYNRLFLGLVRVY